MVPRLSERGISLVGVLIAASVLGFLTLGALSLVNRMFSAAVSAESQHDAREQMLILDMVLRNNDLCTLNFADVIPTDAGVSLNDLGKTIRHVNPTDPSTLSQTVVLPGQSPTADSRNRVLDVTIKNLPGSSEVALLTVSFESKVKIIGGDTKIRTLPLSIQKDATGKISRCSSRTIAGMDGRGCDQGPSGFDSTFTPYVIKIRENLCKTQSYPMSGPMVYPAPHHSTPACSGVAHPCSEYYAWIVAGVTGADMAFMYGSSTTSTRGPYASLSECRAAPLFYSGESFTVTLAHGGCGSMPDCEGGSNGSQVYTCIQNRWALGRYVAPEDSYYNPGE